MTNVNHHRTIELAMRRVERGEGHLTRAQRHRLERDAEQLAHELARTRQVLASNAPQAARRAR